MVFIMCKICKCIPTYPTLILLGHHGLEHIEDLVEACGRVDKVGTLSAHRYCLLLKYGHLFGERGCHLQKVSHGDILKIQHIDESIDNSIIVLIQHNLKHQSPCTINFYEIILFWIVGSHSYQCNAWPIIVQWAW